MAHLCVGEENTFLVQIKKRTHKHPKALLIVCSTKTQRRFYLPLLSQVALTILAIWLCRGNDQLNRSDIEFAIVQTRSPVSVYILLLVVPRLFFQRSAFKRDDAPSNNDMLRPESLDWALVRHRAWGLLYALCCLSLHLVRRQYDKAGYSARGPCPDPVTPPSQNQLDGRAYGKVWLELAVCSVFVYECVLHRHSEQRREIMHQLAGQQAGL